MIRGPLAVVLLPLLSGCLSQSSHPLDSARAEFASRRGELVSWEDDVEEVRREVLADGSLSIDEATRLALVSNSRFGAMLEDLGIARGELIRVSLPANPVVDAQVRFTDGGRGEIVEFSIVQNLLDLHFLPRRRQMATARLEAAKAEATGALIDLVASVRMAYRDLQADLELTGLFRTALDTAFNSYDLSKRLREAGNVIELSVLNVQVLSWPPSLVFGGPAPAQPRNRAELGSFSRGCRPSALPAGG